ncbi:hypothetical protein DPSP01_000487 [Paraphaeosphaeria sporulosa]|uniref:Uncharacterized protein n=1 Tax=Paraphaeosphaeria sporulosa TaxID=1460663 RepID=A0A177C864_9PLEO|nr:uncharacterized protein CC84DRAFT_860332 [Paraphaeosphaeria sporulosa]OAG03596.1 hypothetical protein CC84DRAFT_860332 [Paraphaeosphaeria sporulosa]
MANESTAAPTSENISHSSRHGRCSTPHADESTAAPTYENIYHASPPRTTSDAPLLPHAHSALSTVTDIASSAASTVKTTASSARKWTEAKVEKLNAKKDDGTGPYGSVSTCAPSDLDPIGQGVLPALPVAKKEDAGKER